MNLDCNVRNTFPFQTRGVDQNEGSEETAAITVR